MSHFIHLHLFSNNKSTIQAFLLRQNISKTHSQKAPFSDFLPEGSNILQFSLNKIQPMLDQ